MRYECGENEVEAKAMKRGFVTASIVLVSLLTCACVSKGYAPKPDEEVFGVWGADRSP